MKNPEELHAAISKGRLLLKNAIESCVLSMRIKAQKKAKNNCAGGM